jgi:hypothetical protein
MNVEEILKTLELPDRANDRSQITLRLPFNEYARLHALKETYNNNRSVNDLINLLLKNSLDELISQLPYGYTSEFDNNYKRILLEKLEEESSSKESD